MRTTAAAMVLFLCGCSEASDRAIQPSSIIGDAIPNSLTGQSGDAVRGERIFTERVAGHCILCHQVDGLTEEFQGNLGPNLTTVGERLSAGQIRLRIVDYQAVRPGTVMPSYYRRHDLYDVGSDYVGETFLSAQDVEDLVAYLAARQE